MKKKLGRLRGLGEGAAPNRGWIRVCVEVEGYTRLQILKELGVEKAKVIVKDASVLEGIEIAGSKQSM